ncbi:MAG: ureidoglycolate dehydrogenase [Erysipelotrichales bacterium]
MSEIRIDAKKLYELVYNKLTSLDLDEECAKVMADHLVYADSRGVHSHGVMRMRYYSKRLKAGGLTLKPKFTFKQTGPCSGILDGDNTVGFMVAKKAMDHGISMAKENGLGVVGAKNMGHAGTMSYYLRMAASEGLIAICMAQSDPGVVPFGANEVYFGTNPIGYGIPNGNKKPIIFDMATSQQAWGKIMVAKEKNESIPDNWALDKDGKPTTDPSKAAMLVPMANAKGYGLAMLIDILAGSMLGLNFGKHVTYSFEGDLSQKRGLGMFFIVINPNNYNEDNNFINNIHQMIEEIHDLKPAEGFDKVLVPGEHSQEVYEKYLKEGIPIDNKTYQFLIS